MEQSIFFEYVKKWFKSTVSRFTELINGSKDEPKYLHETMLKKEFSPTLTWASLSKNGSRVAADVVALDSSLPIKRRESIKKAEGDIPKLGMKKSLGERDLQNLDIMVLRQDKESRIVGKLFEDIKDCYLGVKEQLERMFLMALSTGVTLVEDKSGLGIRLDFNHPVANKLKVTAKWTTNGLKPITDLETAMEEASKKGIKLTQVFMNRKSFNQFKKSAEVKDMFASNIGFNGANIPTPNFNQVSSALQDHIGITINVIDRSVVIEADGKRTITYPFFDTAVVLTASNDVGSLFYGTLAEMKHAVDGVSYSTAEDMILLSKYRKNDPLREFSSSQALAVPVIDSMDDIYILDTETI